MSAKTLFRNNDIALVYVDEEAVIRTPTIVVRVYEGYYLRCNTEIRWYSLIENLGVLRRVRFSAQREYLEDALTEETPFEGASTGKEGNE